jgi:glutamate N-acetyltransferase/amino-acid N-acetyltransferase
MSAAPTYCRPLAGGITAARGIRVASGIAGLRSVPSPDVALIAVDGSQASAAATFTTNRFRAAPVRIAERALQATGGNARAIVINAGCANAGTGAGGIADAEHVVAAVARHLACAADEVLPASTGLIGSRLNAEAIEAAIPRLRLSATRAAARRAARAIMTTDTRPKEAGVEVDLGDGRTIAIGGMAKGSGMIHPQMATMLAFIATDAPISPSDLRTALRDAVDATFNQITVDGDTSTNDAVMVLATGAAGGAELVPGSRPSDRFAEGLTAVCHALARLIAADGEGAEHVIEVRVSGAVDAAQARRVARTVAGSSLVKTAVHGGDPNWGRIAAAAGRAGAELDPDRLTVWIGPIKVFAGEPASFRERDAARALQARTVELALDLGLGQGRGRALGCDLSAEYVVINSEYTT